jgi:hypothetical protein
VTKRSNSHASRAWWYKWPVIPALWRLRQEDQPLEASPGYIVRLHLRTQTRIGGVAQVVECLLFKKNLMHKERDDCNPLPISGLIQKKCEIKLNNDF